MHQGATRRGMESKDPLQPLPSIQLIDIPRRKDLIHLKDEILFA